MLNDGVLHSNPLQKTNADYLARQSKFESNVRSYPRKLPLAIAKANGLWVTDVEGNTYLDCLAGAGTLALGHNHPAVMASLDSFLASGLPMHTLDLTTVVKDAFSETLLSLLPNQGRDYCLQFCGPSGADAVEAALKLAKTYTGRNNIISFSGAYHRIRPGRPAKLQAVIAALVRQQAEQGFAESVLDRGGHCLLYTSPSPRDLSTSRMPSSA